MNVLFLNHSGQISGAEQSLRALLRELRRAHPSIAATVALPSGGPLPGALRGEGFPVSFAPLRRVPRPRDPVSGLATLLHVVRTERFLARLMLQTRADIVHSNSTTAHLTGGLAARRAHVPAIWHARDLVPLGRLAPALASRAARVVAISHCVADRLLQDGVPPDKIRVVWNGLDLDEWRPLGRSQLRASFGWPDDVFIFGCAGQMVPWKNYEAFIDAAALLCRDEGCARARFALVGGDLWGEHGDYVRSLRERVVSHGLSDRFQFAPHQADNVDALEAFDALVLPSRAEPFGRVLIEAMALQKAVIAFGACGPLEIIEHKRDGLLVAPDAADGLAYAMRSVLHEPELCAMLGRNARQSMIEKFSIRASAAKIAAIYEELGEW